MKKCKDCKVPITRRVTYSSEHGKGGKALVRCGPCYLKNRRSFRFRRTVKRLVGEMGEELVTACILEAERQ
jgi:hypothetical protein